MRCRYCLRASGPFFAAAHAPLSASIAGELQRYSAFTLPATTDVAASRAMWQRKVARMVCLPSDPASSAGSRKNLGIRLPVAVQRSRIQVETQSADELRHAI